VTAAAMLPPTLLPVTRQPAAVDADLLAVLADPDGRRVRLVDLDREPRLGHGRVLGEHRHGLSPAPARRSAGRADRALPVSGLRHSRAARPCLPPPRRRAAAQSRTERRGPRGVDELRASFAKLARAAQARGELDPAIDADAFGRLPIALLHGMLLQLGAYGDKLDLDAYTRAAELLIDSPSVSRGA